MRALVIGGTRFIGAHVVRRLFDAGAEVTVFHRGTSDNPVLPAVTHIRDAAAAYPILAFPAELRRDWDLVVHMVAMGQADTQAAVDAFSGRARRLVLVSSCDVYRAYGRLTRSEPGEPDPVPLEEDAPLRRALYPFRAMEAELGAYARDYDKTLAEAAVREQSDLDWTILRLPKVYVHEDNADLATVYGFAGVPSWRWTHAYVGNVAEAIALASRHAAAAGRIFNVGEPTTFTTGERLADLPPRRNASAPPQFDFRQDLVLDTGRIRRELGYAEPFAERSAMMAVAEGSSPAA